MSGIIVGKYRGQYLCFDGQQFVLLAAPTRSGKGVAIVIPNLLNFDDSVVVLDIKLENFKLTSGFRAMHGHECFLFAPFSEDFRTHRWNVLDTVSRDRNLRVTDVLSLGQALWPSDVDEKSKFWNDNARNLFLALVLYLMETPELPCTLGEVLRQSSGKGMHPKQYFSTIMAERAASERPLSDDCLDAFSRFLSNPDNTFGNIISTFNAPLLIFASPIVDAATSASDFNINDVRKKRMTIYLGVQPNRLADAALLMNLFFSQLINLNTKELPQNNPELKHQCMLIMDEFTALGKVDIIAKANSFIAGYNIRLLTIIQSIGQLEDVYRTATRTLVTNHGAQIVYPPREQKDANEYSEMLGYFTQRERSESIQRGGPPVNLGQRSGGSDSYSSQKRALMMPQELKEMPQTQQILFVENTKPILCEKARYFDDHVFIDRLKMVSPTLAALDDTPLKRKLRRVGITWKTLPTKAQLENAAFVLNELSSDVPYVDVDAYKARTEQRVREVKAGEQIDLSKLAVDVQQLPALDNPENPSKESVAAVVDAFFSGLDYEESDEVAQEWVVPDTGEIISAVKPSGSSENEGGFDVDSPGEASPDAGAMVFGEIHSDGPANALEAPDATPEFFGTPQGMEFPEFQDVQFVDAEPAGRAVVSNHNTPIDLSLLDR